MLEQCRLLIDTPAPGAWNMSIDQAILESANELRMSTLRVYRWQPATLSLGYFQKFNDRQQHIASLDCPIVRRSSGGGAIVHHHELTYSLSIPSENRWSVQHNELYDRVHLATINALSDWSVPACLHSGGHDAANPHPDAFLCFQRRTPGDIIVGQHKVVGSAQRRIRFALLQHGSILLSTSEFAPELAGLNQVSNRAVNPETFLQAWLKAVARELSLVLISGDLTENEYKRAQLIQNQRFSVDDWTKKR